MNGVDPFRGVKYDSVGSNASPFMGNEAIERDSYVFKPGNKPSAVFCPTAKSLPPEILDLFNRTFIDGRNDPSIRTNAADWYITLNRFLSEDLKHCEKNTKHQYYKYLDSCPYCAADDRHLNEHGSTLNDKPDAVSSEQKTSPSNVKIKIPGRGFGIASMILGICGIYVGIGFISLAINLGANSDNAFGMLFASIIYGVLSFIFSKLSRKRGYKTNVSKSGLIMSITSILIALLAIPIMLLLGYQLA